MPDLFIVGAGPGDPELITVKAYKILQSASVVLYDNLANRDLLAITPVNCEKIYVGKQPYGEYTPQDAIHDLIKEKAFANGEVVRLKGGDPFIFGRGFEELLFAKGCGINAHYIPGISTMQAVGLENIPLTHRDTSESIWIITGTKKDGLLSKDLELAMQSNATVIIYMGMKKLKEIAAAYHNAGYGHLPAAIIQHASLPYKKFAIGKITDLPSLAEKNQLSHPALIIIGNVVQFGSIS